MNRLAASVLLAFVLATAWPFAIVHGAGPTSKIKKCQDPEGKWHYGDTAAEECARAKVIELSGQGVKTREIRAPATDEQLESRARERAEAEEARRRAEDQARRDQQLLATYGHEDDIIYIRDRKLAQIEQTVSAADETIKPLRAVLARMHAEVDKVKQRGGEVPADLREQVTTTQAQITRHEAAIAGKRREQEAIRQQAQEDLERYRELKAQQATTVPTSPTAATPGRSK